MSFSEYYASLALRFAGLAIALVFIFAGQVDDVLGQAARPPAVPAKKKSQDEKPPEPEHMILDTADGVRLKCTYFAPASSEGSDGKAVVPIILLHDWEGNRGQLLAYGAYLQGNGYAVIVPDLRGHGESTQVVGVDKPINLDRFRKQDVLAAVKDIERCKKYLVQRHNEGQLNIDLLSLVAVGKTSVLAAQWTLSDWFAFPAYNAEGIKQGQDVKSLVLISPRKKLAGISIGGSLKNPLFSGAGTAALPMLILWGANDEEAAKDSSSIHAGLEKARPDVSKIEDAAAKFEQQTLFGEAVPGTSLSGAQMMEITQNNTLWPFIESFFAKKVAAASDSFPWKTREINKDE